jgi:hypothetical protein
MHQCLEDFVPGFAIAEGGGDAEVQADIGNRLSDGAAADLGF